MQDIKILINQLTLEEKASLCGGKDPWHIVAIPKLNILSITLSDVLHGLRKQEGENVNLDDLNNSKNQYVSLPPVVVHVLLINNF